MDLMGGLGKETADGLLVIGYFVADELGNIVGLQAELVVVRFFLRKEERLVEMTVSVVMGNVETSVAAVDAPAAEDDPPPVGRPTVVTLCIWAVQLVAGAAGAVLKVKEPKISLFVPNWKGSESRSCQEKEPSVR